MASGNPTYVELTWKVDIRNSCDRTYSGQVTFAIYDASDFKLDQDSERVSVSAHGTAKVRGIMTTPYEKAKKMKRADATASLQ